jgi:nucleotide-binding universal stress UspA family protein
MLNTILVPLDGSALAEAALPYAAELSIPTGARLLLVRSAYSHTLPGLDPRERKEGAIWEAEDYLTQTAAGLIRRGYNCQAVVPYGKPADCIVEQARMSKASLIVMSTHGRTGPGRLLFGSVAEAVVSSSSVPVLITRAWLSAEPQELLKEAPQLFLVPLDGSAFAETALEPAMQLADDFGAGLLLVTAQATDAPPVEERYYLPSLQEKLRHTHPDMCVEVQFRYGSPRQAIDEAYRQSGASLIIMATHGRTGFRRSVTGSVAGGVLKESRAPLVLVRPPAYVEGAVHQTEEARIGSR